MLKAPSILALLILAASSVAQTFPDDWLVLPSPGRSGRSPIHTDALELQIVRGLFRAPKKGEVLRRADGRELTWSETKREKNGVRVPRGGYAFATVEAKRDCVRLLDARGHGLVYVNGALRGGNAYGFGYTRIPVRLRKGRNEFLFRIGRGSLRAKLLETPGELFLLDQDLTKPDRIVGEAGTQYLGVLVVNASGDWQRGLSVRCTAPWIQPHALSQLVGSITRLPPLAPHSIYKASVALRAKAPKERGSSRLKMSLERIPGKSPAAIRAAAAPFSELEVELRIRGKGERHVRCYRSEEDGSTQYFAVNPPTQAPDSVAGQAFFLSLHGAGVRAPRQTGSYAQKRQGWLVAPTNRRPFGFDWEDWGRRDAIDVLDRCLTLFPIDPTRVYLTGHSMGGHGTWQVGVTYPDRFAAIAPSAGWISFWTYAGGRRLPTKDPVGALLMRAANPSETLGIKENYKSQGIYILHGDADRTVPIAQAREMWKVLETFHHDHRRHEQPGAGHWWNSSDEPGADCVDWQGIFDFFAMRRLPRASDLRGIDFSTMDPAISSRHTWIEIRQQERRRMKSRVRARFDPHKRRFHLQSENVARLRIRLQGLLGAGPVLVDVDGTKLEGQVAEGQRSLELEHAGKGWSYLAADRATKPLALGPFKQAFRRDFVLVIGTKGSAEETRWALEKARYDAESFWYRGNGSVEIYRDVDVPESLFPGRNLILYGNRDTHGLWTRLLSESPIQVSREAVQIGARSAKGKDLACLFTRPKPGEPDGLVGIVAGTGMPGLRLSSRLPYFVSGVHYPDFTLIDSSFLARGLEGVRCVGFYAKDGSLAASDTAWREKR